MIARPPRLERPTAEGRGRAGMPVLRAPKRATPGSRRKAAKGRASTRRPGKGKPAGARRRGQGAARPLWQRLLMWSAVAAIWILLLVGGLVLWYARDLPDIDRLAKATRNASVTLVAADGSTLAHYGDLYGKSLTVQEMSPWLPKAVLAIEDRRFYDHFGVDLWGVARALFVNVSEGELRQGGSTITQQLAKNLFLTPERSLKRKIQEAILAIQLENRYAKDQILALYLNRVYLGAGTYGVDAAAQRYFGKSARDLTLYESAVIAGLLKAPSRYNPANDAAVADSRAKVVLDAMAEAGFVTAEAAARAYAAKAEGAPPGYDKGRFFADWALTQAAGYLGQVERDVVVQTTLDPRLQAIAEQALDEVLAERGGEAKASQGAVVVLSPQGQVLAMVGGRDYGTTQFNRATQALRQPGSAFKLFVFLAGLEAGLTPDTTLVDGPVTVEGWSPDNYNDRYYGPVSLREGFARSLNSIAVQVMQKAGKQKVVDAARRLGITTKLPVVPAISLGVSEVTLLELTAAYAVFANQGYGVWPYGIEAIRGTEGTTLFRKQEEGLSRLVAPSVVDRMTDLLGAVVAWGTGKTADPGRPTAGKTGTTQSFRDAWFVGYTAELVVGVWIGNDDDTPMEKVTGGSIPAEVFRRIVVAGEAGWPVAALPGGGASAGDDPPVSGPSEDLIGRILEKIEQGEDPSAPPVALTPRAEDPSRDP
jgi:penicillin-binding protein 1A